MRHNQKMNYEQLRDEVRTAVDAAPSQAEVARSMDISRGAVNRAMKETGPTLAGLQIRILEHLTPYRIEQDAVFTAKKR